MVTIFNPLIAFLALAIIPINTVVDNQDALLSYLGGLSGGNWLSLVIGIDAALVLSGAVLTSFVGVGGLMERMALDRILPSPLLKKNAKGSSYIIFILFFGLCASILLVTDGDLAQLAGIYTIAFLLVMVLFGIGTVLLKVKRSQLPRPERSSWIGLFIAIAAVTAAIVGNIILNPGYLVIFFEYLIPTLIVVFFMLYRVSIFKAFLKLLDYIFPDGGKLFARLNQKTKKLLNKVNSQQFVFFTKNDDIATLNRVMQYVSHNEPTKRLKIVSIGDSDEIEATTLPGDIKVLDRAYPEIDIEYIVEPGTFCPEKITELSKRWNIPTNFMFIGSPSEDSVFSVEELGEVRLVI